MKRKNFILSLLSTIPAISFLPRKSKAVDLPKPMLLLRGADVCMTGRYAKTEHDIYNVDARFCDITNHNCLEIEFTTEKGIFYFLVPKTNDIDRYMQELLNTVAVQSDLPFAVFAKMFNIQTWYMQHGVPRAWSCVDQFGVPAYNTDAHDLTPYYNTSVEVWSIHKKGRAPYHKADRPIRVVQGTKFPVKKGMPTRFDVMVYMEHKCPNCKLQVPFETARTKCPSCGHRELEVVGAKKEDPTGCGGTC